MPEGDADLFRTNANFRLTVEMFYPVPADVSYDFSPVNLKIAQLICGWTTNEAWRYGKDRSPLKLEWSKPEIRHHEKPASKFLDCEQAFIVCTKFTMHYPWISDQGVGPYLEPPA